MWAVEIDKEPDVVRCDDGERGCRARADDEELCPSEHEAGKRPEAAADVEVLAAGVGHPRAEFGVDEPPDHHKRADDDPGGEDACE